MARSTTDRRKPSIARECRTRDRRRDVSTRAPDIPCICRPAPSAEPDDHGQNLLLATALLVGATVAQARFLPYGQACPNARNVLRVQGLPKLGSTFTVNGIMFPGTCTRKHCPCPCCDCNLCAGAVLFLGVARFRVQLPGGCDLLVTPDIPFVGNLRGDVAIPVPNVAALNGARFYMQRMDVQLREVTGTQCNTSYRLIGVNGSSNGVEAVAGR